MHTGPKRSTYVSRADVQELDLDQIVGKILMRMTPRQFETRCTHNKVHFILSDEHRCNTLWNETATLTLLGKGPRFIPKAKSLSEDEVRGACARLGYRMVRTFERFIRKDFHEKRKRTMEDAGIRKWTPKQISQSVEQCRSYVSRFFKCDMPGGGAWQGNQGLSPFFDRCISRIETDIVAAAAGARKILPRRLRWPNLSRAERDIMLRIKGQDVSYSMADKNYGPVISSRELVREQCLLNLEDAKDTYSRIVDQSRQDIIDDILGRLLSILRPFKLRGEAWKLACDSLIKDSRETAKKGRLSKFYIIWKLHKTANSLGLRSRPIAAAINYVTGPASHFLHCQLQEEVWKHPYVLKDSLDLIRILEKLEINGSRAMLTVADVNALYPSIQLDRGMTALRWFMDNHTDFCQTLKDLCLKLANFVLINNYVECDELDGNIYRQNIGTAMGTSFSVVYAIIFMIWLETPIINNRRFSPFIKLYKRFIDDLLIIWTGTPERLCELRKALEEADVNISLDWSGYSSKEDAVDPMIVDAVDHTQVNYLDLDMSLKADIVTGNGFKIIFSPFRKPGNAYAYIPFNSFHARHTFRGWILAELLRLLTHSSSPETWREEGLNFYYLLCSRGYPRQFLRAVFKEVLWERRSHVLYPSQDHNRTGEQFFKTYRACVLTLRNAPEWPLLKERLDLNLQDLVDTTYADIFPRRAFLAQCNAPRLGSILKR